MELFTGLFDSIDGSVRAKLDASRRVSDYRPGEDLFRMGARADRLFMIASGRAKVWRPSRHGSALTLYYVGAGSVAGLVSLVRDVPLLSTVTATTPVKAHVWPASVARDLIAHDARFASNGLRIVSGALGTITERLEDLADAKVEQQIARAPPALGGGGSLVA